MKKLAIAAMTAACALISLPSAHGADSPAKGHTCGFCKNFSDSTLRVNYIFGGGPSGVTILRDGQSKSAGWYGRRTRLKEVPRAGNGNILVLDPQTGDTLYNHSFSGLFLEWINIPEAKEINRSFENSFLVPLPNKEADIKLVLRNNRHKEIATHTYRYRPDDELVAVRGQNPMRHVYIHKGADPKKAIDVAMLSEGYREEEMDSFINHARKFVDEMLSYEPYASMKDRFNFVAVMVPSRESGVSIPLKKQWKDTAFGSHYSTFYSARYLTTPHVKKLHDSLAGIPYEHIMILVNTDQYGGGGIYNSYHIAASNNKLTLPVTVHEFGHSFGGLADEYFYTGEQDDTYPLDIEPWEPNITTMANNDLKWKHLVTPGTKIPTAWVDNGGGTREERMKQTKHAKKGDKQIVGAFEGGGYKAKGVFRPVVTCRMRDNYHPTFCPVCEAALRELIDFYTAD